MRFSNKKSVWITGIIFALVLIIAISQLWKANSNNQEDQVPTASSTISPQPQKSAVPPTTEPAAGTSKPQTGNDIAQEQVDIVLIGSELEGLYLARAAADEGLKVKILDPRADFGGQILQGQMLFLDDVKDEQGRSIVQGRTKELFDGFKNAKIRKLPEFTTYMNKLALNIPIESGIIINEIQTDSKVQDKQVITSVSYTTKNQEKKRITASYWVDNTDHAALLSKLQVNRLPGLEKFYGQSEIEYMSSGMMMKFKNVDWNKFNKTFNEYTQAEKNKRFGGGYVNESYAIGLTGTTNAHKPSNDRVFLRGLNAVNQRDGEVLINALLVYTVDPANPKSVAEAVELGNKETELIAKHFRNTLPGWENVEVNGFPTYPYIREYNHYEADYVLKPSDLLSGKMHWDNVSIGGYPLDLQGTSANKWGIEMGRPDKYGMPLRSFLLKNYDNVIMAGKNVGSSAIAYGSTRIQPNTSLAAESIGIILGKIHGKQKLKELKDADMKVLHQQLTEKYQIKLTGMTGKNKIEGWTEDEIRKLDTGEITYPSYVQKKK
jgi:ribulose 1,5-bisphosphate synthetase/thiazole synthase